MSNPFETSGPNGSITTTSRLKVWFLTKFRGYRVLSMHRLPKESSFGELYYRDSWVLVKDTIEDA